MPMKRLAIALTLLTTPATAQLVYPGTTAPQIQANQIQLQQQLLQMQVQQNLQNQQLQIQFQLEQQRQQLQRELQYNAQRPQPFYAVPTISGARYAASRQPAVVQERRTTHRIRSSHRARRR